MTSALPALALLVTGGLTTPQTAWSTVEPAAVDLDSAGLAAFAASLGGRGCVTRHGRLAFTWGDATRAGDVASAAKPVYVHALLKALETGRLPSLDQAVATWVPELAALNADLDHKDRAITWRHLATQTSCYGVRETPGTAFCYNDQQMALFWDALFLRVYATSYQDVDAAVLRPLLAEPLGCEDHPSLLAFGAADRPGRLAISPRDFCRFGLLYLNRGRWGDRQLLDPELVDLAIGSPLANDLPQSTGVVAQTLPGQRTIGSRTVPDNQTDHLGSYSFCWWRNGLDRTGQRHWPHAPLDALGCFGHGGRRVMVVFPRQQVVASWNDTSVTRREEVDQALGRLAVACR